MTPSVSDDMVERLREHLTRDLNLADALHDEKGSATVRALLDWLPALSAALPLPVEGVGAVLKGNGWVFWNPDSGEEYSPNHPVESGECDDAEHIRKATGQEDALWAGMQEQFKRANALASPSAEAAQPVAEPVEWLWYGEADGKQHISFGRWQSHESQHRYKYADIQATEHDHPSQPQGELREALIAGWNACRKSVYAVCEDVGAEADRIRIKGPVGTHSEEQHSKGYHAGMHRAAKSIARGFNSMEAEDDDNLRAALAGRTAG